MNMPETLARLNLELQRRRAAGLSSEVADVHIKGLLDPERGVFVRMTFVLDDGERFEIDTDECAGMLAATVAH